MNYLVQIQQKILKLLLHPSFIALSNFNPASNAADHPPWRPNVPWYSPLQILPLKVHSVAQLPFVSHDIETYREEGSLTGVCSVVPYRSSQTKYVLWWVTMTLYQLIGGLGEKWNEWSWQSKNSGSLNLTTYFVTATWGHVPAASPITLPSPVFERVLKGCPERRTTTLRLEGYCSSKLL